MARNYVSKFLRKLKCDSYIIYGLEQTTAKFSNQEKVLITYAWFSAAWTVDTLLTCVCYLTSLVSQKCHIGRASLALATASLVPRRDGWMDEGMEGATER